MHTKKAAALFTATAAITLATVFGTAGSAFADGNVTWKNDKTGKMLSVDPHWSTGQLQLSIRDGWTTGNEGWRDTQQSDGGYTEKNLVHGGCLDGNWGQAYWNSCNGSDWQHWYEVSTSTGWKLQSVHTGYVLDADANTVYTNPDYGDGDRYQRWH